MSSGTPTILKTILARKREEVALRSKQNSMAELLESVASVSEPRGFHDAIKKQISSGEAAVIAEINNRIGCVRFYDNIRLEFLWRTVHKLFIW